MCFALSLQIQALSFLVTDDGHAVSKHCPHNASNAPHAIPPLGTGPGWTAGWSWGGMGVETGGGKWITDLVHRYPFHFKIF